MVERHADDIRAAGAQAFFFLGGTTTPLTVFQDSGESSALPHPVVADADGRWPDIFIPYIATYDVQVKTAEGVQLTFTQLIPNPNPVDTTVIVPPENQVQTGMIHGEFVNATKAGYVRLNGRTIGSPSSTATERANVDTQDLFIYLWNNLSDAIAPVSGGRGASGAADFGANKAITLPDMRGSSLMGLDDMGNSPKGAFTGISFTLGGPVVPGSISGSNLVTLNLTNVPAHSHGGTTNPQPDHTHNVTAASVTGNENQAHAHAWGGTFGTSGESNPHQHDFTGTTGLVLGGPTVISYASGGLPIGGLSLTGNNNADHTHSVNVSGTTGTENAAHTHNFSFNVSSGLAGAHSHPFATDSQGGGQPFNNLTPVNLITWFIKL
jgi:hypothetical protein